MTKTVTDTIIDYCNNQNVIIGLIPSRRQVEHDGGYANNWSTSDFSSYVKKLNPNIPLIRDHGGPNQGAKVDNGTKSMAVDCVYLDGIHIDIWKKYQDLEEAIYQTCWYIDLCARINDKIFFEIGTEEAIRKYSANELDYFLNQVKIRIPEYFDKVKYAVIQSGTSLKSTTNTGKYDKSRLSDMVEVCGRFNLLSKEHNGDYITQDEKNEKFLLGLDCINIAPEFGVLETETILASMSESEAEEFFSRCLASGKWIKWVAKDFVPEKNKTETIKICGHYIRHQEFIENFVNKKDLVPKITDVIKNKIEELYTM